MRHARHCPTKWAGAIEAAVPTEFRAAHDIFPQRIIGCDRQAALSAPGGNGLFAYQRQQKNPAPGVGSEAVALGAGDLADQLGRGDADGDADAQADCATARKAT